VIGDKYTLLSAVRLVCCWNTSYL